MIECPHCQCDSYYEKRLAKYVQYFDYEGQTTDASEFQKVSGGKRKYCQDCHRDITKHFRDSKE